MNAPVSGALYYVGIRDNTFYENEISISGVGNFKLMVEDNILNYDGSSYGTLINDSRFVSVGSIRGSTTIQDNSIYNVENGIMLTDADEVLIQRNYFDMEHQTSGYSSMTNHHSVGIYVNNEDVIPAPNYTGSAQVQLLDNKILHSKVGIQAEFAYADIKNDSILEMNSNMANPFPCGGSFFPPCEAMDGYGIRALNDVYTIQFNKVENNSSLYSTQPKTIDSIIGISLENTANVGEYPSIVSCNRTRNVGIGLRFSGSNDTLTTVERNHMEDEKYGFVLKNNGFIGDVGYDTYSADNIWKSGTFGNSATLSDNSDGSKCTLYVQNGGDWDPPINAVNDFLGTGIVIAKDNLGNSSGFGCSAPLRIGKFDKNQKSDGSNSWVQQTINQSSQSYVYNPSGMLKLNGELLFRQLFRDSSMVGDPNLKTFYDSLRVKSLGVLLLGSNSLISLTTTEDSVNYIIHRGRLDSNFVFSSLSKPELSTLLNFAQRCPYNDGLSVYLVRKFLFKYNYPLFTNSCETSVSNRPPQLRLTNKANNGIGIFPNPTNAILHFIGIAKIENCQVDIYNSLGKFCHSYNLIGDGVESINIENLQPGMYIYRLYNNSQEISKGKFIKH